MNHVQSLAQRGRRTTAELVAHLSEVDRRGLHLSAAHESIYEYCRRTLRFSEGEAYNRAVAARAARRFPVILDMLMQGAINLTTVTILEKHLSEANHLELLVNATGKTKMEVLEIVARLAPQPDVRTSVRRTAARTVPPAVPSTASAPAPTIASIAPRCGVGAGIGRSPGPTGASAVCEGHPSEWPARSQAAQPARPRRRAAGGGRPRWAPVRFRGRRRSKAREPRLAGARAPEAVDGRWRSHRREHPYLLSLAQPARRATLLRTVGSAGWVRPGRRALRIHPFRNGAVGRTCSAQAHGPIAEATATRNDDAVGPRNARTLPRSSSSRKATNAGSSAASAGGS
jgi:hypothetical protein